MSKMFSLLIPVSLFCEESFYQRDFCAIILSFFLSPSLLTFYLEQFNPLCLPVGNLALLHRIWTSLEVFSNVLRCFCSLICSLWLYREAVDDDDYCFLLTGAKHILLHDCMSVSSCKSSYGFGVNC